MANLQDPRAVLSGRRAPTDDPYLALRLGRGIELGGLPEDGAVALLRVLDVPAAAAPALIRAAGRNPLGLRVAARSPGQPRRRRSSGPRAALLSLGHPWCHSGPDLSTRRRVR
ncbi:hypothetical protein [Pseudonocardia charpentierae]|uniref:Uncharacterized protein n=1 Tax=Pseudonocardia charpentierae TaxID=3075545 RepID=A0ABU2NIB8_9PSEU|nr:hypothetical protein [Pseudonocardia sp. DSM 45834]MDT0353703.1 hypothetical protein [Pseudonocardia sp. DSM 45834]